MSTSTPIADYALISDCQGAALVSRTGSIDWACLPRFDSASTFARLLDQGAGHWSISPEDVVDVKRQYVSGTMVLETRFRTATADVVVVDALALGPDERGHEIGRSSPNVLVRSITCESGHASVGVEIALRPEYGLTVPILETERNHVYARGGPTAYVVSGPAPPSCEKGAIAVQLELAPAQRVMFALDVHSPWEDTPDPLSQDEIAEMLERTINGWRSWSSLHQTYDGPYANIVKHSGRVLQALTYAPTGAIVAAPTTSLPEAPGGTRNWDYRFSWVRDASLTLQALWVAACPDEAQSFFSFLATAAGGETNGHSPLQIMYGISGERLVTEHELTHLSGWRGSQPVRIGNGAWNQVQLDVYGELLTAAALLADEIGELSPAARRFLTHVADTAASRWRETDQGIWEVRGEPQHFLYSKLMCWAALDRAIRISALLHAEERVQQWSRVRDEIRAAILEHGWSDTAGAYTQAFGSDVLDASALHLAISGFLPADDPRMRATIEAIAGGLTDERGLVYRYRADDGFREREGTFVICSFWLVRCLALLGEVERARTLFELVCSYANDVELLAEEVDGDTGELLGNFPQAFSHIGLVNAAWSIAQAESRAANAGPVPAGI